MDDKGYTLHEELKKSNYFLLCLQNKHSSSIKKREQGVRYREWALAEGPRDGGCLVWFDGIANNFFLLHVLFDFHVEGVKSASSSSVGILWSD